MLRRTLLGVILALGLAGTLAGGRSGADAVAQDVAADATAAHPLVGGWIVDTDADDPDNAPAYQVVHADGNTIVLHPGFGPGVGLWQPTEDGAAASILFQDVNASVAAVEPGMLTLRWSIAIDAGGDTFGGPGTFAGWLPDATPVDSIEGTVRATRLTTDAIIAGAPTNEHPAVGAWSFEVSGPMGDYAILHADGTMVRLTPAFGIGVGVWQATEDGAAEGVTVYLDVDESPTAAEPGTLTERVTLAADAAGEQLDASFSREGQRLDGELAVEQTGTLAGTPMTMESLTGTPSPATDVPADDHPLLGLWMRIDPASCPTCYFLNHPDGTTIHMSSWGGVGLGVWAPTGARTGERATVYYDVDLTDAVVPGELMIYVNITVDEAGNTATADGVGDGERLEQSDEDCGCSVVIVATETLQTLETLGATPPSVPQA